MGKLSALKPSLSTLSPTVAYLPQDDGERAKFRAATSAGHKWYHTARWKRLRAVILLRDLYTCQLCKRIEANASRLVADHITPHKGDERLFWDETNLQALCWNCHSGAKQRAERGRG